MNPSKKNLNGWILCPSKSFPGKFYYFNVANGETAWSLNEIEKKSLKNPTNQHCYPEPTTSPPVGNSPPTASKPTIPPNLYTRDIENNIWRETSQNNYPKDYTSNRNNSSNVSTFVIQPPQFNQNYNKPALPIQIQVPMIIGSDFHNSVPQVVMILMNQNTSNGQLAIEPPGPLLTKTDPIRDLFVQTGNTPLCQRFINYEKPVLEFTNNKIKQPFSQYNISTPNKSVPPLFPNDQSTISPGQSLSHSNDIKNHSKPIIREPILNIIRKSPEKNIFKTSVNPQNSHSNFDPRINQNTQRNIFNNPSHNIKEKQANQNLFQLGNFETNPFKESFLPKPTLNSNVKVDILKSSINTDLRIPTSQDKGVKYSTIAKENATLFQGDSIGFASNNGDLLDNLDESDLRRILLEKKRKAIDSDSAGIEGKKIKTYKLENPAGTPKKKVSFNLVPESISDITSTEEFSNNCDITYNSTTPQGMNTIEQLKQLASPSKTREGWYVVVDTTTLIEELPFLDNFVKLDPKCYLLIPSRVMSDTGALSRGECRERRLVTLARHTLRRLAANLPHIIVEPSSLDEDVNQTTADSILNCCIDVMEQNSHVVLVTNDMDLQTKAEYYHIPCFNCEQIKEDSVRKPQVHFDIKKIKISITNDVQTNFESPANSFRNPLDFDCNNSSFQNRSSFEFPFRNDVTETGRTELERSTNADDLSDLKIHNIATDSQFKIPSTPKTLNIPNSNEIVSFFHKGNSKFESRIEGRTKNLDDQSQSVFYFQNEGNKEQRVASIFEIENDRQDLKKRQPKSSIFEIDGIEKIENNFSRPSIFDDNLEPILQKSNSEHEIGTNKDFQLKKCNFQSDFLTKDFTIKPTFDEKRDNDMQVKKSILKNKNCKNLSLTKPSIFDNEKNDQILMRSTIFDNDKRKNKQISTKLTNPIQQKAVAKKPQSKLAIFEKDCNQSELPDEINNEDLEDYIEKFILKNEIEEKRIEEKKEEIICNFQQAMEECLTNVLQQSSSIHKSMPPWTLQEALQCIAKVYDSHTTLRTTADILRGVLNSKAEVKPCGVLKIIACGILLVLYLMRITPNSDALLDAEESLRTIIRDVTDKDDIDIQAVKTPVICHNNAGDEVSRRRNFVKDRSEVVKYLKKYFPAWANYNENLRNDNSKPSWGQKSKDVTHIVRTYGKNIGMLKINKTNTMSMNQPNNFNATDNKETSEKEDKNTQITLNKDKDGETNKTAVTISQNIDAKKIYEIPKTAKSPTEVGVMKPSIKITRSIENNINSIPNKIEENINEETNQTGDLKLSKPKVIRLFNNIKLTKDNTVIDSKKPICNLDYTHGHTFGTDENAGPKVVRNVQMIKEFEEKLKSQRKPLDLDMLDYTAISDSENDEKSIKTDNECLSITIDDEKKFIEANDYDKNETNHLNAKNGGTKISEPLKNFIEANDYDKNETNHFNAKNDGTKISEPLKNFVEANDYDKNETNHHLNANNDSIIINEPQISNVNEQNSSATNNDSYSMSLDICVSNDFYSTNDAKNCKNHIIENHATNDNDNSSINENNFSSDRISCATNVVSYGTNDHIYTKVYHGTNDSFQVNDFDRANDTKMIQDDTNDSGFENESLQAYSILKSFLCELNESFKMVHQFIERSIKEFKCGVLIESKRRALHSKADATHAQISKIIDKLKCITQRETADVTSLNALIAGAGSKALEDKQISRYRYVVTQCLRQAQMLDRALKIMLSVTDGSMKCISLKREKTN